MKKTKTYAYDVLNDRIRGGRKSDTIGTITTTCGQLHARTGWRLIEIYEKADSRMLVQG